MATDKHSTFRQKMAKLGLIQANEWVPRDRRELFKAVAKALRDGVPVTIGEVASNPEADRATGGPLPRTPAELLARRRKPAPRVASDPEAQARKAKREARQASLAISWALAPDRLRVLDMDGRGYEARITMREPRTVRNPVLDMEHPFTHIEGLVLKGRSFVRLEYEIWPKWVLPNGDARPGEVRVRKPYGFRVVQDAEVRRLRKVVRDLHPDKGGPGGAEFKAAKDALDALTGRV